MLSSTLVPSPLRKLRAFAALALLPLLAACGQQATSATPQAARPVQIQHVAFQPQTAKPRVRRRGAGAA